MPANNRGDPTRSMHPQNGGASSSQVQPLQLLITVCWMATALYILAKALPYWMPITLSGQHVSHGKSSSVSVHYYFYNEQTGQVQWEDPGGVPFEDETGMRYWILADGSRTYHDPGLWKYQWVEQWSAELNKAFYYNQETRVSVWERPPDLAWRRIAVQEDE